MKKPPSKKLTNEAARKEYESGLSTKDIADKYGLALNTVQHKLRAARTTLRKQERGKFTDQLVADMYEEYLAGLSTSDLSRKYGLNVGGIWLNFKKAGLTVRTQTEAALLKQYPFPAGVTDENVREFYDQHGTTKAASHFRCSKDAVRAAVLREGGAMRAVGSKHGTGRATQPTGYVLVVVTRAWPFFDQMARRPYNNPDRGRVAEHRKVVADSMGRALTEHETVHHMNGDRADNRLENLQLRQARQRRSL